MNKLSTIEQWMLNAQKVEKKTVPTKKTRARTKCTKIIHPIFESASIVFKDKDIFWSDVLLKCARGSFPKGFTYKDKLLIYGKGKKRKEQPITDDPKAVGEICIVLFREQNSMLSEIDRQNVNESIQNEMKVEVNWSKIHVKDVKYSMLTDYVMFSGKFKNFSKEYRSNLLLSIYVHVEHKKITSANIVISDGRIVDIKGIYPLENGHIPLNIPLTKFTCQKNDKQTYYIDWTKHIYNLLNISYKSSSKSTKITTDS